jgi:hypothetical protein
MKNLPFRVVLVFTELALIATLVSAQSSTGSIVGTVKNRNAEVISGAQIVITQLQTNKQFTVMTNGEGYYTSPPLAVGEYRVEARVKGFRSAVHNRLPIQIQQTLAADFTLEVGEVSETVEVTTQAQVLETTSSVLGKVVDNRQILDLPLNTRNVYSLIFLTPGVSGSIGNNYNTMSYSVNGARPTMMDTVIRWCHGLVPNSQRVHWHFHFPVGGCDSGIQGHGSYLSR